VVEPVVESEECADVAGDAQDDASHRAAMCDGDDAALPGIGCGPGSAASQPVGLWRWLGRRPKEEALDDNRSRVPDRWPVYLQGPTTERPPDPAHQAEVSRHVSGLATAWPSTLPRTTCCTTVTESYADGAIRIDEFGRVNSTTQASAAVIERL
jgi:hypothetical protein